MLPIEVESWIWYSVAVLIILSRYVSRWIQLGSFKAFQTEDYVMLAVLGFYTSLCANMNTIDHLDTNLMLPSDIPKLTPADIASRTRGSKLVLVVEQSMIMTQWGCKFSLLLLYNKLTFGLRQQIAVKIVGAYVVINLIVMETLYFGVWCRPFHNYWAVPTPNVQCSAAIHHLITNAVFNISSDVLMLLIPLPLLLKSRLPPANKLILCVLFSLGIFVILCAVLNKYYSFAHPFSPMWEYWYIREASTAIYVANMPMCWSLARRVFHLRAFDGVTSGGGARTKSGAPKVQVYSNSAMGSKIGIEVGRMRKDTSWWDRENGFTEFRTDSEEHITGTGSHGKGSSVPLEIWEEREVDIDRGSVSVEKLENSDLGERRIEMDLFDGNGSGKEFTTRTTISVVGPLGRSSSKARSKSRGRSRRGSESGSRSGSDEGAKMGPK